MTNTYKDTDPIEFKTLEELRCIRCCLERILQSNMPSYFVDYQMEKFGGNKNYPNRSNLEREKNANENTIRND